MINNYVKLTMSSKKKKKKIKMFTKKKNNVKFQQKIKKIINLSFLLKYYILRNLIYNNFNII